MTVLAVQISNGGEGLRLVARRIFGVNVLSGPPQDVTAWIDARIEAGDTVRLAFLNAHASNLAARDPDYRAALDRCLVLNDGIGVEIAARVLHGRGFPANLNGTDFIPHYLAQTRRDLRVALLGAAPGVAKRAGDLIAASTPRHSVVFARDGYFATGDLDGILDEIRASGADMLLVALGNPAQEHLIVAHGERSGARLLVGVGGLFDFMAGSKPRAPRALRRAGLEWAFRLGLEPRRLWRRYLVGNPLFLTRLAAARIRGRRSLAR